MTTNSSRLRAGDWVEVRSKEDILRTLDGNGCLDGMPFMPEMFAFCGRKFQVYKRAHKTCDTVFPVRGRHVAEAVHLETRCDGSSHGGCQASCLLFWKDAWLKPLTGGGDGRGQNLEARRTEAVGPGASSPCTESTVLANVHAAGSLRDNPTYRCQATQLPYATSDLEWWAIRQYVEDYASGNVSLWRILCGATYFLIYAISRAGLGLGRVIRFLYDKGYPIWGGAPYPRRHGRIPEGESTPAEALDIEPGELVRIKTYADILKTLNTRDRNRGLYFDAEEVPYCGTTHRVLKRVNRIIDERTGKMLEMKTPCIILDSVICNSRYSECRLFCPRSIYAYWREIWLERVEPRKLAAHPEAADEVVSR